MPKFPDKPRRIDAPRPARRSEKVAPAEPAPSVSEPTEVARLFQGSPQKPEAHDRPALGDESLDAAALGAQNAWFVAEHLMILLSKKRARMARAAALEEVVALVRALPDPHYARRVLFAMGEVGRIVDIYPLEVLVQLLERAPGWLPSVGFEDLVLNKTELLAAPFAIEEEIRIRVPLSAKIRAFALEGGGSPGYCFQPGRPGEYLLELAHEGRFSLLLRGELRRRSIVDRVKLTVRPD